MNLRILLADDHCIVRQGLRALLERAGHSAITSEAAGAVIMDTSPQPVRAQG